MNYLQRCPVCGNETEYLTKAEMERDWSRWWTQIKKLIGRSLDHLWERVNR